MSDTKKGLAEALAKFGDPMAIEVDFESEFLKPLSFASRSVELTASSHRLRPSRLEIVCSLHDKLPPDLLIPLLVYRGKDTNFIKQTAWAFFSTNARSESDLKCPMTVTLEKCTFFTDHGVGGKSRRPDRQADSLYSELSVSPPSEPETMRLDKRFVQWLMRASAETRDLLVDLVVSHNRKDQPHIKLVFKIDQAGNYPNV